MYHASCIPGLASEGTCVQQHRLHLRPCCTSCSVLSCLCAHWTLLFVSAAWSCSSSEGPGAAHLKGPSTANLRGALCSTGARQGEEKAAAIAAKYPGDAEEGHPVAAYAWRAHHEGCRGAVPVGLHQLPSYRNRQLPSRHGPHGQCHVPIDHTRVTS